MRLDEVLQQPGATERSVRESIMQDLHVALPGTIISYDADKKTATVQPSIREWKQTDSPPLLTDVPVFFPGYFTFAVQPGDECLVIFSDQCIDAWFKSGGVSTPLSSRRHDLSDGFALVGFFAGSGREAAADINALVARIEALEQEVFP